MVLNDEVLMKLFLVLDDVVGSKSERFANYAVSPQSMDGRSAFLNITKPEIQIEALVNAVYQFFELTKSDKAATFRVALAEMGPKHIEGFFCFNPKDKPSTNSVEEYQKDWCGFSRAKKNREIVIVANIAKEMKKKKTSKAFVQTKGGSQEGSMIVYPIIHRGLKEVVYCLSVLCSVPDYFRNTKTQRAYYCDIMEKFGKRIDLEHSLRMIKGRSNEDGASGSTR